VEEEERLVPLNPVRWKYLSAMFLVLSLAFLSSTFILPTLKVPQTVTYNGPVVPYYTGDTSLSGYYIPPVAAGSKVVISFYNFIPGSIDIAIFPTQLGDLSPSGPTIYAGNLLLNASYKFTSTTSQPYGMYVGSHNNTLYILKITATFSPYFWVTTYSSLGVIASFASGVLFYYYNFTARRWRLEQQAIREATGQGTN